MGELRPWHIAVLVVVMILLFGAKRLPDAARSLGRSMRILKAETRGLAEDGSAHVPTPPVVAEVRTPPSPIEGTAPAAPAAAPTSQAQQVRDNA